MWKIHGKVYDLTPFLDKHPGGRVILEACEGDKDVTAAFESNHAMCDMGKIRKIMAKYEVGTCEPTEFKFEQDGFYQETKDKVRSYFSERAISHHSDWGWVFKSTLQFMLWAWTFAAACFGQKYQCLFAILSGHMMLQWGFTVMHDASHFAISSNPLVNENLGSIWNSLAVWDAQLWARHHVYKHHSFTGLCEDPDTINFAPLLRKSLHERKRKYASASSIAYFVLVHIIFPGMFTAQCASYNIQWFATRKLWRIKLKHYRLFWREMLMKLGILAAVCSTRNGLVIFSFALGLNMTYAAMVLPDHDTFDTHMNAASSSKTVDWGELQVRNSGNFATTNPWICRLFGGINYQIEHHLFPTISHIHYPKLSRIVKAQCAKHNISYVDHPTMVAAVRAALNNYQHIAKQP